MNKGIRDMFEMLIRNAQFLAQISADVSALKTVVSRLGPEAQRLLEEQIAIERDKSQKAAESAMKLLDSLRSGLPKMQS
jgi:hypothetical protein